MDSAIKQVEGYGSSLYYSYTRSEWSALNGNVKINLPDNIISSVLALNDRLTGSEIQDYYFPLAQLLQLSIINNEDLYTKRNSFLGLNTGKVPYIIGVTGSVAVGKSTTSRLLKTLLLKINPEYNIYIVSTDNFLKNNKKLEEEHILARKGFPESFEIDRLINFLLEIKSGIHNMEIPIYSHIKYDITSEKQRIENPDIIILEGLNTLQINDNTNHHDVYVSDFIDFSIYIDSKEKYVKQWYIERFLMLMDTAFKNRDSYFRNFAELTREEAIKTASEIWDSINGVNYRQNIIKTRYRASLIIEKGKNHHIENIKMRKL
ncbi:MAG: type I pantothenate kinase [Ferroplasma sp.]